MSKYESPPDLQNFEVAHELIDKCYNEFCSPESLRSCESKGDKVGYNLRLRTRDFATVVEADRATHAGDIGRLTIIWKKWALMAHCLKGLPRYALHLTRFLVLVEQDLPPELAKVILHSMLIPSVHRPGHFVGNDLWLEHQNFWLKHFFNQTVSELFLRCL